jgi:hypothetical protein
MLRLVSKIFIILGSLTLAFLLIKPHLRKPEVTALTPTKNNKQHSADVVVILQKDYMDCGVAAFQAMLAGYGISADYAQLRARLKTEDEGTSTDEIEKIAPEYGLLLRQVVVPPERIFLPDSGLIPSIAAVKSGDLNHMILLWEIEGDKVEVLDPAVGRVFLTPEEIQQQLIIHEQDLSEKAYKAWACDTGFLEVLQKRMSALGLTDEQITELQNKACHQSDWKAIAVLDAKTRKLTAQKNVTKEEAFSMLSNFSDTPELDEYRFASKGQNNKEGEPQVALRGAVLLVSDGRTVASSQ